MAEKGAKIIQQLGIGLEIRGKQTTNSIADNNNELMTLIHRGRQTLFHFWLLFAPFFLVRKRKMIWIEDESGFFGKFLFLVEFYG